jgi:hypothetical protein
VARRRLESAQRREGQAAALDLAEHGVSVQL